MRTILFVLLGFGVIGFSSCLKDSPYMDVSNTSPIIEFGQSAANGVFGPNGYFGAFPFAGDTAAAPVATYDTAVALVLASPQVLNDSVHVTIAIDSTQLAPFNSSQGDSITMLPSNLYSIPQTLIGIAPGSRVGVIPITINLSLFPAHHQYGLPIKIVSATDVEKSNTQIIVSGNSGTFMWLFQR